MSVTLSLYLDLLWFWDSGKPINSDVLCNKYYLVVLGLSMT
jgi:hypothetical protein